TGVFKLDYADSVLVLRALVSPHPSRYWTILSSGAIGPFRFDHNCKFAHYAPVVIIKKCISVERSRANLQLQYPLVITECLRVRTESPAEMIVGICIFGHLAEFIVILPEFA